jgi:hypothetical protein
MNQTEQVNQSDHWRSYYASSWTFMLKFFQHFIDQGETDPLRLIRLVEQIERKFGQAYHEDEQRFGWKKIKFKAPLPNGTDALKMSSFKGKNIEIPYYAKTLYSNFILDFLQETGDVDCIVKLGCGYGRNLFELFYGGGPRIPYYGGELALAGQRLGATLANLNPDLNFSFHQFDLIKPDLAWLPSYEKVFFMTVHSIEQVHKIGLNFFRCLIDSAPHVIGMHLEPFGFQVNPDLGPITKKHNDFFKRSKWNINFYEVLLQAKEEGLIDIDYVETELFFPEDPGNPTSVAIWRKKIKG